MRFALRAGQQVLPLPDLPNSARSPHKLAGAREASLFVGAQRGSKIGCIVQTSSWW